MGTIYGLAVIETPGNIRLVSASYEKTLRLWITSVLLWFTDHSDPEGMEY